MKIHKINGLNTYCKLVYAINTRIHIVYVFVSITEYFTSYGVSMKNECFLKHIVDIFIIFEKEYMIHHHATVKNILKTFQCHSRPTG